MRGKDSKSELEEIRANDSMLKQRDDSEGGDGKAHSSAFVTHALSRGRRERLLPWSVADSRWVRAGRTPLCEALDGLLKQSSVAPSCQN